jgi:hypothetical protein
MRLAAGGRSPLVIVYGLRHSHAEASAPGGKGADAAGAGGVASSEEMAAPPPRLAMLEELRIVTDGIVMSLALDAAGALLVTGGEGRVVQLWSVRGAPSGDSSVPMLPQPSGLSSLASPLKRRTKRRGSAGNAFAANTTTTSAEDGVPTRTKADSAFSTKSTIHSLS